VRRETSFSPRSTFPTYVRWMPTRLANCSWDSPLASRYCRRSDPNFRALKSIRSMRPEGAGAINTPKGARGRMALPLGGALRALRSGASVQRGNGTRIDLTPGLGGAFRVAEGQSPIVFARSLRDRPPTDHPPSYRGRDLAVTPASVGRRRTAWGIRRECKFCSTWNNVIVTTNATGRLGLGVPRPVVRFDLRFVPSPRSPPSHALSLEGTAPPAPRGPSTASPTSGP